MRTFFSALFILITSVVFAASLTPETFVLADLAAREVTVQGMQQQVGLLLADASADSLLAAAEANRQTVNDAFSRYGTTGAAHTAYGTRATNEILRCLEEHPEWVLRYDQLNLQFESLSSQLHALRGGN